MKELLVRESKLLLVIYPAMVYAESELEDRLRAEAPSVVISIQ